MRATGYTALRLLSKFAIVKAPAVLAVGAAPFAWILVLAAGSPAYPRDRADYRLASKETADGSRHREVVQR
jgi:hypothetical protein